MILGDAPADQSSALSGAVTTLDDMFRRAMMRHPDLPALVDPQNRGSFTDGPARSMTYTQADAMISAIALRLRRLGLSTDSVIGIQLPNTIENILTILGVLRAGMIAAPLPLLWRQADSIAALSRVGVKALITCGRIGNADHGRLAMDVAAEIFPIRYVCGYGAETADGIIPFDDLFERLGVAGARQGDEPSEVVGGGRGVRRRRGLARCRCTGHRCSEVFGGRVHIVRSSSEAGGRSVGRRHGLTQNSPPG